MNKMYIKLLIAAQTLLSNEDGQDLVEYALLLALLSLGTISSTQAVSAALTKQFGLIAAAVS